MANNVRSLENINWHMTKAEAEARAAAEKPVRLPPRPMSSSIGSTLESQSKRKRFAMKLDCATPASSRRSAIGAMSHG